MERIIKYLILLSMFVCTLFLCKFPAVSEEMSPSQLTIPQTVSYDDCTKTYSISAEKLFYLTLASISANRFEIKEMQSKTGYILFKVTNKEFLATVVYYGLNKSMLKITPTNNNYYFAPGIVYNIFKYIDLNYEQPVDTIPKAS